VICLALDSFGEQVLSAFRESHLANLPTVRMRLTTAMHYHARYGFQEFALDRPHTSQGRESQPQPSVIDLDTALDQFVQALYQARTKVCSQLIYRELLQEGLQIGTMPEIYVFAQVTGPAHVQFLRMVVARARAYLQQFEPMSLTGLVSLAEYEGPLALSRERDGVLDELNTLLAVRPREQDNAADLAILDRCYVITQETLRGQSLIPVSDLVHRTAGFLAAHYLDGIRQPMTSQQFMLFGKQAEHGPYIEAGYGLCDLFGYADLRLEVNHILDWCANKQAARLLGEVLLRDDTSKDAVQTTHTELAARLKAVLGVDSLPLSADQMISHVFKEIVEQRERQVEAPAASYDQLLSYWGWYRQRHEQLLQSFRQQVSDMVNRLQQQLEQRLSAVLEDYVTGDVDGSARAEAFLASISAWGNHEMNHLREQTPTVSSISHVNVLWMRLARILRAFPPTRMLAPRIGLLLLVAFISWVTIDGVLGGLLAGGIATFVSIWIIYRWIWLPWRLRAAQASFQQQLARSYEAELRVTVESDVKDMLERIVDQFAPASSVRPLGSPEYQRINEWRARLRQAAQQCLATAQQSQVQLSGAEDNSSDQTPRDSLRVTSIQVQSYYERLTQWTPDQPALEFLGEIRGDTSWHALTIDQLAARMVRVCRKRYKQQSDQQMPGLEYHLLNVARAPDDVIAGLLKALINSATPMARLHRLHGHWPRPQQQLLIVHDPEQSVFRSLAEQVGLQVVGGANEQQIICICTEHLIPVRDLAITFDWQRRPVAAEGQSAHA